MYAKRLIVLAALVLAVLMATRALALNADDIRFGDKNAVDYYGQGTTYTFSAEVNDDPHHINIPIAGYSARTQSGGNYTWSYGDGFSISVVANYGNGKASGHVSLRGYHYILLCQGENLVSGEYYGNNAPEGGFDLSHPTVSGSKSQTVTLQNLTGNYYHCFVSNLFSSGGVTVYNGSYSLSLHTWVSLTGGNE
jgi:hypothetical protein